MGEAVEAKKIESIAFAEELPEVCFKPCIYFLICDEVVVYVGQSICLPGRVAQHKQNKIFDRVIFIPITQADRLTEIEYAFINALKPEYNTEKFRPLHSIDQIILQSLGAGHLIPKDIFKDFKCVTPGEYGEVRVVDGEYKGRVGYYDDEERSGRTKKLEAIVYLSGLKDGPVMIPFRCLERVDDDEPEIQRKVAETFLGPERFKHMMDFAKQQECENV